MQENSYEILTNKNKIIFLAGLFDGEGSFGIWSKGKQKYFCCQVETADKDMIQRFKSFFGGTMSLRKARKAHHKDLWRWRLNGKGGVKSLELMIKYMCKRRQEKFYVVKRTIDGI